MVATASCQWDLQMWLRVWAEHIMRLQQQSLHSIVYTGSISAY